MFLKGFSLSIVRVHYSLYLGPMTPQVALQKLTFDKLSVRNKCSMERFTIEYEHHGGRQTATAKCRAILVLRTRFEGLKNAIHRT